MIVTGLAGGWTSPYLAFLLSDHSNLPITEAEASWIASLMNAGRLGGGIIAAFSVEYLGSGRSMFLIGFPTALGWVCAMFANHVNWLYAARVLVGTGVGMTFGTFPIYLGEIADPSVRGALVSLAINGAAIGTVLGNLIGTYVPMAHYSMIALVPTVIYVVLFTLIPESPHHLLRVGKTEEAEKALQWYNRSDDIKKELECLKEYVFASSSTSIRDRLHEFNAPHNRKAGFVIIILFMFMQLSGMNSLLFYMEIILTRAGVTVIPPATVVIIGGVLSIVIGWVAMYLIERSGRRALMIVSSLGIFFSMMSMGSHIALLQYHPELPQRDWMSIGSMLIWQTFYCLGVFVVPSTVLSELFPANLKTLAACGASITSAVFAFVSTKSYQPMVDAMGEQYVFWLYGLIAVLAVPFSIIWMPETKGKSLREIQDILTSGGKRAKAKAAECEEW